MYNYTIKTTLDNEETLKKIKKGAKNFEIQLLGEFHDKNFHIKNAFDKFNKDEVNIISVHSPLDNQLDKGTIYLENITFNFYKEIFFKTCELAQMFATYYKHPVNVIIHNGFRIEDYLLIPTLLDEIVKMMDTVIQKYPNIYIEIENVTPVIIEDMKMPYFCSGIFLENIDIVNYLNKNCDKPIFKTVLDVCHYLTSIRIIETLTSKKIELEEIFEAHKNTIGTIHLANLKNLGFEDGRQDGGFEDKKEDIELLTNIIYYINKYLKDADICLEITEDNYFEVPVLLETIRILEKIKNN